MVLDAKIKDEILEEAKIFLNLSEKEVEDMKKSKGVDFLVSAPFIVNSSEPKKVALLHLVTYLGERRGARKFFKQYKGQGIENRLAPLCEFIGGDEELIKEYKKILKLFSLRDHKADKNVDRDMKKFNPILEGENMEDEIQELSIEVNKSNSKLAKMMKEDLKKDANGIGTFWW